MIFDRLKIQTTKLEKKSSIYDRVLKTNKIDETCFKYRRAITRGRTIFHEIKLNECHEKEEVLYRDKKLWISDDVNLLLKLIWKSHDLSICDHFDVTRTNELLRRYYYWSNIIKIVKQYVRNCRTCCRFKASRNVYNDLLIFVVVIDERWQDIVMNFIINFFKSNEYNVICTVIDKLFKKRHYIFCKVTNEKTSTKITTLILINWIFKIHDLFRFITSNRDFQFVIVVWKSFCKRLNIKCNFFTVFHFQSNESSKRVNQNVETYLRKYYNYMQDDWAKWLIMIEFSNNDRLSKVTKLIFFFANKNFHSRITFKSNDITYNFIRKRLLVVKAENIIDIMINIFKFMQNNVERFKKVMSTQANKHRKPV